MNPFFRFKCFRCADIAEASLQNCQQRYSELKKQQERRRRNLYKADFVHADSTRERLRDRLPISTGRFDLAFMQFAFHYSFESLEQAERLLQNVSECLRPGACFVGTTVDALQVMSRARHQNTNILQNDLFRIRLPIEVLDPSWKPPLFGFRYDFQLHECVDCPEFLVYFPVVIRLAAKFGLKLMYVRNFADYFAERYDDKNRALMIRMRSLQAYPLPSESDSVDSAGSEFEHADRYLRDRPHILQKDQRIGTLSASEWQIASLYCVFAFRKCDT
jgi:mRNA (guanine-N7-)-methyltransferase